MGEGEAFIQEGTCPGGHLSRGAFVRTLVLMGIARGARGAGTPPGLEYQVNSLSLPVCYMQFALKMY